MRYSSKGWPRDTYADSDKWGAIYVKMVSFGADGVGKTCLMERLISGEMKSVGYSVRACTEYFVLPFYFYFFCLDHQLAHSVY